MPRAKAHRDWISHIQWISVCLVVLEFAFGWLCHAKIIMRGGYTQGFWDLTIIVCVCATFVAMDGDGWQDYLTSSTTGPLWKLGMGFMQSVTASGIWAQTTQSCILIWNTILNGKFKVSLPFPVEERSIAWIKQPDSSSGVPNYINNFENTFLQTHVLVQMFEKTTL